MRKRTLFVLLFSVFLMLVGSTLFLISFFTQAPVAKPNIYTIDSEFQNIEIDLKNTNITICSDTKNYIEITGYRESEYYISKEDGKLLLTDQPEKSPILFKLSGIGQYFQEMRQHSESKSIIIHLAQEYWETPINLILKNSTLSLSAPLAYLTLHAEKSTITAKDITFDRFSAKLLDCNSSFSMPYTSNEFSRNIETHNTTLSINNDERANTEHFVANFQRPSLIIEASGGVCRLQFPQDKPHA